MREEGVVIESQGDRARIRVERSSACKHCSARALCRPFGETSSVVTVRDPIGVAEGQRVAVVIPPAQLVKSSLAVYGIPVAAVIAGAVAGAYIGRGWSQENGTDIGAIIGASVLLALSLVVTRVVDQIAGRKGASLPRIVAILGVNT